jgi:hypothetical protein
MPARKLAESIHSADEFIHRLVEIALAQQKCE